MPEIFHVIEMEEKSHFKYPIDDEKNLVCMTEFSIAWLNFPIWSTHMTIFRVMIFYHDSKNIVAKNTSTLWIPVWFSHVLKWLKMDRDNLVAFGINVVHENQLQENVLQFRENKNLIMTLGHRNNIKNCTIS